MLIASVMALLLAISAFFSLTLSETIVKHKNTTYDEKLIALQQSADLIDSWYKANAFSIDSVSDIVPPPTISNRWGITILTTGRIDCGRGIKGHIYAIVIPGINGVETTIDTNGNVIRGKYDIVKVVDGCAIQQDIILQNKQIAESLAASLENYFRGLASQEYSPPVKNFFTNPSCGGWGDIPCINDGRNNANILAPYLGLSQRDYTDVYGRILHFDNASSNVNALSPPFSARVGFDTPWGETIWMIAASG